MLQKPHRPDGPAQPASAGASAVAAGEPSPEARLASRIEAGDRQAEEHLVDHYGRGVALILDRHSSWRGEVDDLFQETFRVAIEKLRRGELREPSKLPAFLAQIARNLSLDSRRKRGRRKTEPDAEAVDRAVAQRSSPLGHLLDRESATLVRRVLAELRNDRDREVLFRFYLAEEDRSHIAEDLGLDTLQLNRVLYRARQRYRALYEERMERVLRASGPRRSADGPATRETLAVGLLVILTAVASLFEWLESW